ncbi:MAG: YHS domain-containing protein [Polyangia bacterium]
MKMKNLLLCALLSIPLAACEQKKSAPETMANSTAVAAALGNDATVPKLAAGTKANCPVTGEEFTVKDSTVQVTYNGKRYGFCCADCQPTFAKNPAKYVKN